MKENVGSVEVSVSLAELDKKRYLVLLKAVELGLKNLGINVFITPMDGKEVRLAFKIEKQKRRKMGV